MSGYVGAMVKEPDRYTHGHHESVLRSHQWRTADNSAAFLLPLLEPGAHLLDVGCGPGSITADLASLIDDGSVVGIDRSATVIEIARREHHATGSTALTFEVGDVYALEYDDVRFDAVFAHQVLQHLSDPVAALREMHRVLRPGGLVAVRDADFGAFVWSPPDLGLDRWMSIYQRLTANNRADANAGRHLHTWVRAAGFRDLHVSSSTWTFQSAPERQWWGGLWADRVRESEFAHQALELGLADRAQLQSVAESFLSWADDDEGIFIVVHGEVLARR